LSKRLSIGHTPQEVIMLSPANSETFCTLLLQTWTIQFA
jgi:hypothetical protein